MQGMCKVKQKTRVLYFLKTRDFNFFWKEVFD